MMCVERQNSEFRYCSVTLGTADALLVSFGYQTVHVMPVLDGHPQTRFTRRINIGGLQVDSFMQRLLQLKYPSHLNNITLSRAEVIIYCWPFLTYHFSPIFLYCKIGIYLRF